jgi:two-component system nitrogen regulation sensor histidine kinase GlnL
MAVGAILENLTTALVIVGADNGVVFMNTSAEGLFGISRNQAQGRMIASLLPGLDSLDELIGRTRAEEQSFGLDLTFSVPHQDRINVQVVCRVSPLPGDAGELILEFFDATQWRQHDREQALISQHGVSRRIIRQLAHEIRNPLGGLRGAAQLLERELSSPELREYTRVIIGEADRLVTLTKNLLGPTQKASLEPTNIHELIERVVLLIQGEAPQDVTIVRDYDPSLPEIALDSDQIMQALLNISRNAVEAIAQAGTVTLRTRALTNFLIGARRYPVVISVEIEDDGPGIPDDMEDSIFFPLVTGRDGGTGLGLPLAQDLVSRHGGLVEFESDPGRTVFMVRLPLVDIEVIAGEAPGDV